MEKYLSYIAKFKKQLHMYRMTQLLYKGYVCAHYHSVSCPVLQLNLEEQPARSRVEEPGVARARAPVRGWTGPGSGPVAGDAGPALRRPTRSSCEIIVPQAG